MSRIRHYDTTKKQWVIDAANNASNIELTNSQFVDDKNSSISVDEGFTKVGNRLTKLEHNLAWVYQNGAKGGSGSGGGGASASYTLTVKDNQNVFYTTSGSLAITLQIDSGGSARSFKLNVINASTNTYLISGESHKSMSYFTTTIPNLTEDMELILQAYDATTEIYTPQVYITVKVSAIRINQTISLSTSQYQIGSSAAANIGFYIENNTEGPLQLLLYDSTATNPVKTLGISGGTLITTILSGTKGNYNINLANYIDSSTYNIYNFKVVVYSALLSTDTVPFISSYFSNPITVVDSNNLSIITYNISTSPETASDYSFKQGSSCSFQLLFSYYPAGFPSFYYRYKVYDNNANLVDESKTIASYTKNKQLDFYYGTSGLSVNDTGEYYYITLEVCSDENFSEISAQYAAKTVYFCIEEGDSGILTDYKGSLLMRFTQATYPAKGTTTWTYSVPTDTTNDFYFNTNPIDPNIPSTRNTSLKLYNTTDTTGILSDSNSVVFMNLSGNTYAKIDRFAELFPDVSVLDSSLFGQVQGFYMQVTYAYQTENPIDQTILSFGTHDSYGNLYSGFEINSDNITLAFGGNAGSISTPTPIVPENYYESSSTGTTQTITVGLNCWYDTILTKSNTTTRTKVYYFNIYIDGVMSRTMIVPASNLAGAWNFADALYLGCRPDLSNQANCNIYDFKFYADKQSDLSIVWNWMASLEQSNLINGKVNDSLDTTLRTRNLFVQQTTSDDGSTSTKKINSCLLCGTDGNYLSAQTMYNAITTAYTEYALNYPIILLSETATSSAMKRAFGSTWAVGSTITEGDTEQNITDMAWNVNIDITTKYGTQSITGGTDEATGNYYSSPTMSIQGTSSLSYKGKNIEIKMGETDAGDQKLLKINGWLPENEYTLKADVVDSAHVNNTAIGNFVNNSGFYGTSCPYKTNVGDGKTPTDKIVNTVQGFPCLVFVKYADGTWDFFGIYNFNLGRYSYYNLGLKIFSSITEDTTKEDDQPQIITEYTLDAEKTNNNYSFEVGDNWSEPEELFQQADLSITQRILECRYPKTNQSTAFQTINSSLMAGLATMTSTPVAKRYYDSSTNQYANLLDAQGQIQYWTGDSTALSESNATTFINVIELRKYYMIAVLFAMVDSMCKNLVFRAWTNTWTSSSKVWHPSFYDMDTADGLNNRGAQSIVYYSHPNSYFNIDSSGYTSSGDSTITGVTWCPERDTTKGLDFAAMHGNRLWEILNLFEIRNTSTKSPLAEIYWDLRKDYIGDPDDFVDKYFANYINQSGAIMYNYDYKQKYVNYGQTWVDGIGFVADTESSNADQGSFLYGTRIAWIRSWFKKRINFLDSVYMSYNSDFSGISSILSDQWSSGQQAASTTLYLNIAAAQKMKIAYQVSSDSENKHYLWIDENTDTIYTIQAQTNAGNLWYLWGNKGISSFVKFNQLGWDELTSKLNFPNLKVLNLNDLPNLNLSNGNDFSNLTAATTINLANTQIKNTAQILNMSGCLSLQNLDLSGTNIRAFILPSNGSLVSLNLTNATINSIPKNNGISVLNGQSGLKSLLLSGTSISTLELSQLPSLIDVSFPNALSELTIDRCDSLSAINLTFNSSSQNPLSSFTKLVIDDCPGLQSIDLSGQNNLQVIEIRNCPNITSINLSNTNYPNNSFILDFSSLTKLNSIDITNTSYITKLDLSNSPDLSNIQAGDSAVQNVICTYNASNPIELPANAFKSCNSLTNLEGYFSIQGQSVFEGCGSLNFDSLMDNNKLYLTFGQTSSLEKCFANCAQLGRNSRWPETLIHRLNSSVQNMREMFSNTASNFYLKPETFAYLDGDKYKELNVTDISGIFQNTQIHGTFYSQYTDDEGTHGFFQYMPQLLRAESAFAGNCNIERYIDNNFFHFDKASLLQNVDYMFSGNAKLIAVSDTSDISSYTEQPLSSKDFFIDLIGCIHNEEKASGGSFSIPNPDWPYPTAIFGGTNIKMNVDLDKDNHPYLFHLKNNSYKDKTIYLENNLYSGIHLILDSDVCEYSYLFGGTQKTVSDGTTTYYIPKFAKVTSPFTASDELELDLSNINGTIFFDGILNNLTSPFQGMKLTDTDTIPATLFKGATTVVSLQGFFSGLGLDNTNSSVFDFEKINLFEDCSSLKDISAIFSGCYKFRMKLASNMFENCVLTDVSNAFANSRVIGQLPKKLFYMNKGNTLKTMTNVFNCCYNLGYDETYKYKEVAIKLDGETFTTWDDHIVANPSSKLSTYEIPEDLFWYCTVNPDIGGVLGQMFWNENTVPDEAEAGIYPITKNTDVWIGPNCTIPEKIFQGEGIVNSDTLEYVFSNTHFKPSGSISTDGTFTRGNQYPDGLFYNMKNLTTITGMFSNTIIDAQCKINKDLFALDDTGENYVPLTNISEVWSYCTFTWKASEATGDTGSPQLDFDMFDTLPYLTDINSLFAGKQNSAYGLHQISEKMFANIAQTDVLSALNIGSLFAYCPIDQFSTAPLFKNLQLTSSKNTYLSGISPTQISNAMAVKNAGLAPDTDEWNEYNE